MTPDLKELEQSTETIVLNALNRAYQLGQTYWQQADSESYSQNAKSDVTAEKFRKLRDETRISVFGLEVENFALRSGTGHLGELIDELRAEHAHELIALQADRDDWKARAEAAEAELARVRAGEPFGWYGAKEDDFMLDKIRKTHERLNSHTHRIGKYDTALFTAPQPAAQTESIECDCGRIHKKTRYGWACSEPAQPDHIADTNKMVPADHVEQHLDMVEQPEQVDWKDQYEKQKRRAEMWIAKYEKDIGPLEKVYPAAQPEQGERAAQKAELLKNLTQWLDGLGLEIHTYSLRGIALHGFEKGWDAAMHSAQPVALPLTPEELELCRQWFDSVQDLNGGYLTPLDYVLAEKLYKQLNMRVPNSVSEITGGVAK